MDGGPEFTAHKTQDFLARWGVNHRKSLAYYAQSNGRAKVAVKTTKRALVANTGLEGDLNTDNMVKAMLAIRNTPGVGLKRSPVEIIFNKKLNGLLPMSPFRRYTHFENPKVDPVWKEAWRLREEALRTRAVKSVERRSEHTKGLPSFKI